MNPNDLTPEQLTQELTLTPEQEAELKKKKPMREKIDQIIKDFQEGNGLVAKGVTGALAAPAMVMNIKPRVATPITVL